MKRILLSLAFLLVAFDASAQMVQPVLQRITPAHRLPYDAVSVAITSAFTGNSEMALFTCTTACFVQIEVSGRTPTAVSTGVTASHYLPADTPALLRIPPNGKVAVIRLSSAGVLIVQEVSR